MTPPMVELLFWSVFLFGVWWIYRSKRFRGACEDLKDLYEAPENTHAKQPLAPHMTNPIYQYQQEREKVQTRAKQAGMEKFQDPKP